MSTLTLPEARPFGRDDDGVHLVCCDEDVALCGSDRSGRPFTDNPPDCDECIRLAEGTCGAAFCRLRQWWRGRSA